MDALQFFTASSIVIVAGKGGVGKTTVAASLGLAASRLGLRTLLVEVEGKRGLATLFDQVELHYDDAELAPRLHARTLRADDALIEYLEDKGLRRFARRLGRMQVLDTLATSTPGIKDLIILGKIKQIERQEAFDLVVVDAPAAGHAITFLRSARGLLETVSTGPVHAQAVEVDELLTSPERCRVFLVTVPEETPVNELIETAYRLEDEIGVKLGPVVVNGVWPELTSATDSDATTFYNHRIAQQHEQLARLQRELPLEQLHLPFLFTTSIDRDGIGRLADAVGAAVDDLELSV